MTRFPRTHEPVLNFSSLVISYPSHSYPSQGFAGELDMDAQLADMEAERRRPMNVKQLGDRSGGRGGPKAPSKKRQARDSKFGECANVCV